MTEHLHRLPRHVMESPSLEILKSALDMVLRSVLSVALLEQRGCNRWPPEVPFNLNDSVVFINV